MLGNQARRDAGALRQDAARDAGEPGILDASTALAPDSAGIEARPPSIDGRSLVSCASLGTLAARGVLTPRHAKQVLFAKDRSAVVLRVAGSDAGAGDEVLVVHLPGGEITYLAAGAVGFDWIAGQSRVLVRNVAGDLTTFALDGTSATTLARATCEHRISSSGNRVLIFEGCEGGEATLVPVDSRTGTRSRPWSAARNPYGSHANVVFSPGGNWFAYRELPPAPDGSVARDGIIHVVDTNNNAYALTMAPGAAYPEFASDKVLLFATNLSDPPTTVDVRAHVLGGFAAPVIARGVAFDGYGYHVSPDGQWMLGAVAPFSAFLAPVALAAYSMDGREIALAGDLFPIWSTQMLVYTFAFSADSRHVVYLTAGTPGSTAVVASTGGQASSLSSDLAFVIPPTGSLVALSETRTRPTRIRLTDLDTLQDVATAEVSATPAQVTFTPDGRSLIFVEKEERSPLGRLRHLSGGTGASQELAKWTTNLLTTGNIPCCNEPGRSYPIDPTGCFTLVDSDLDGTRLVLLP